MASDPSKAYVIPVSRGVPAPVLWLFAIGFVLIVFMGGITVQQARENHSWPAKDTPLVDLHGNL